MDMKSLSTLIALIGSMIGVMSALWGLIRFFTNLSHQNRELKTRLTALEAYVNTLASENHSSKLSELKGRLDTLESKKGLQEQVEKVQQESLQKLQQQAAEWHNHLAADLAQQQAQVHASLQQLKTHEASSLAMLTERAQQLVQPFQEIEQAVEALRQEKVSTRLANLEVQVEKIQSVISRKQWWPQLDEPWQAIFKEAIGIKGEPTEDELEAIFSLTKLECYENQLTHLEPLRMLTGLQILECWNNQLTSLEPLRALTGLQELYCYGNQLTSLEPLRALTGLRILVCSGKRNQLTNLEPLQALTGLQTLGCSGNQLTSLELLRMLTGLQDLDCSGNQLTSLEPLQALMGLQTLDCRDNQLTSLEPLHGLKSLKKLNCWNNPSLSVQEIERFKKAVPSCKVKS